MSDVVLAVRKINPNAELSVIDNDVNQNHLAQWNNTNS
jgi:hypothetical protein